MSKLIVSMVLLASAARPGLADVSISLADDFPEVGAQRVVTVSGLDGGGYSLWVVYSPTSETQEEVEIGPIPDAGAVSWTPLRPGIATLSVRDGSGATVAVKNVAILFSSTPGSGVLVMIFAGLLLFGGAGLSMWRVLREGVPPPV